MITSEELRNHIPRLKMGKHHIFAGKLNNYLDQQEKVNELFMVSDEIIYIYELPSINIRNTRRLNELKIKLRKIKGELESELNDKNY